MKYLLLLFTASCLTFDIVWSDELRQWTSSDGKQIQAKILGFDGETIRLETSKGTFEIPLSRVSETDQNYAKDWAKKQVAAAEETTITKQSSKKVASRIGNFEGLELGSWPKYVVAELDVKQIELEEDKEKEIYIYRTPHFEFHSPDRLSISVVREFARIFEATFAFVDQMPIGLGPQPPTKVTTKRNYIKQKMPIMKMAALLVAAACLPPVAAD